MPKVGPFHCGQLDLLLVLMFIALLQFNPGFSELSHTHTHADTHTHAHAHAHRLFIKNMPPTSKCQIILKFQNFIKWFFIFALFSTV